MKRVLLASPDSIFPARQEDPLRFTQFRVRHHGDIARLELGPSDSERLFRDGLVERVTTGLKGLGYCYVTLDLEGFRSGSMNEPLLKRSRQTPET